jgi:hypothetical protein
LRFTCCWTKGRGGGETVSDNSIFIGAESGGANPQTLELSRANRHGLIAGATGTGRTVTLRRGREGRRDCQER